MENLNVLAKDEEKPPPRVCPRCNSDNTKFSYYNNYSVSQPRYFCMNCRRYWTHGGALKDIPIGGSSRKSKRAKVDQPFVSQVSQVVSVDIQQVNHHQHFVHFQENNEFVGSFGGFSSSSAAVVVNHFGPLPDIHGGMITNVTPIQSFRPMDRLDFSDGFFQQHYYDFGSSDLIGSPLINQSIAGHVDNHNGFHIINPEEQSKWNKSKWNQSKWNQSKWNKSKWNKSKWNQSKWNQSFNNTMNMNHNARTSGTRGSSSTEMSKIINSCVFRSSYHLERHGL